ncbi:MAG: DNA polymerase III subunit gamma/tau [Proteobacteria bacterium]|uniref:DNA polymerase III subunit gamma/tau n=1 Tax=Rudaea sp. TaxID=2136325 RepID=UPI003220829D|nr:DNA polymerase III subunit gamma/tau [Pseudomonadota bacterium]
MSYQVLARKWRPKKFSELVGQEHVVRALGNALDSGRMHHAFLFTGTRGVGKTTIARIFAKSLNCEKGQSSNPCGECATCRDIDAGRFMDLLEIDAASNTGVDDVREVIENAQYTPSRGRYKVYLIDEVHMLSKSAFNALLKTLEEPPPHVKFLLATTDPQKLPVTVLSRCLKFNLKRLLPEQISGQMRRILDAEQIAFEPEALAELARGADGSLRDGLSLLDQAIAYGAGAVRAGEVRAMLGTIERGQVHALIAQVHAGDGAALMAEVDRLAEFSPDFAQALDEIAAVLHRVQLKQLVRDYATAEEGDEAQVAALAAALSPEETQLYYQFAVVGRRDLPLAPTARAGFEMTLLRMLAFRPVEAGSQALAAPPPVRATAPAASVAAQTARAALAPHAAAGFDVDPKRSTARVAEPKAPAFAGSANTLAAAAAVAAQPPAASAQRWSGDTGDWLGLIETAGLKGPVGALAQHCTLIAIEQNVVRLALKPEHEHFSAPPLVAAMEEKIAQALGRAVKVRFEKNAAAQQAETPAEAAGRARDARQQTAERALNDDPIVQALMRDFDARLIPESVKPVG